MNRIYRNVWNARRGTFVAAAESTRSQGKASAPTGSLLAGVLLGVSAAASASGPAPGTLPTGGQVVGGSAAIQMQGSTMTVNQGSERAALNWQSFSIGSGATVQFVQPSARSVALNRVVGNDPSQIWGSLRANGQVFLVNPNGVLFAPGSQVSAAGILASTRDMSVADFMAGRIVLQGAGNGRVVNQGSLSAADGGYVVLVGAQVINEGGITAHHGDVRLAAADKVRLQLDGGSLVTFEIDRGTVDGLVANHGAIRGDAGRIWLTANALDALSRAVVNHDGLIEAHTVGERNGTIVLLGDMQHGQTIVNGRLDASAPQGGPGGFVETSAAKVTIGDSTRVDTRSADGRNGTWLIDPTDFVVAASGGDMTGSTLSSNLGSGNVTIQSTSGSGGTDGKVVINDAVSWSANRLTLDAQGDIEINENMTGTGTAQLTLKYGQQAVAAGNTHTYTIAAGKKVDLPDGQNLDIQQGSDGTLLQFTVISTLGASNSSSGTELAGIANDTNNAGYWAGLYALGADLDASATATFNQVGADYLGFRPIGSENDPFTGRFEGLGHTISDLTINRGPATNVGLFGNVGEGAVVSHLNLADANVTGNSRVGALAGQVSGTVRNVTVTGMVTGGPDVSGNTGTSVGGVVGLLTSLGGMSDVSVDTIAVSLPGVGSEVGGVLGRAEGTVRAIGNTANTVVTGDGAYIGGLIGRSLVALTDLTSAATVTGGSDSSSVGGLVGILEYNASLSNSSATGAVSGRSHVGGLVGTSSNDAHIVDAFATGDVSGSQNVGGLVGTSSADVVRSHATGDVTVSGSNGGGLIGATSGGDVIDSWASGAVDGSGADSIGGLIGATSGSNISGSYVVAPLGASGPRVVGGNQVGGLVGSLFFSDATSSHAEIDVQGGASVGGLVGESVGATIGSSYATGAVTGVSEVGGLLGKGESVTGSYATGDVNGQTHVGGLVGYEKMGGTVSNSYASGAVTGTGVGAGGLVGLNEGTVKNITQMPAGQVVSGADAVGGLVGINQGEVINSTVDAVVTGTNHVGGLIGHQIAGPGTTMTVNSTSTSSVTATGGENIGGLIGSVEAGDVGNSTASGAVDAATSNRVGGLIGYLNGGNVTDSTTSSSVDGQYFVGGAIGYAQQVGSLSGVSASGAVDGAANVGGLIGSSAISFDGGTNTTSSTVTATGGSVGGYIGAMTSGTVTNVTVSNAVTSTSTSSSTDVGGVVGYFSSGVLDTVTASNTVTLANGGRVGGIAGKVQVNAEVRNATFSGTVSGKDSVGGLAGSNTGKVLNATMSGTVNGTGSVLGGAFGLYDVSQGQADFDNVVVSGAISGNEKVGGLIGSNNGYVPGGDFSVTSTVNAAGSVVGGYVGENLSGGTVDEVNATNAVVSTYSSGSARAGGLVGHNLGTVTRSSASNTVQAVGSEVGGAVGLNDGNVDRTYATGAVSSSGGDAVGGLIGVNSGTVSIAYAAGAASGGDEVGGFIGRQTGGSATDVYATGSATGADDVGGLVGNASGGSVMRAYATGAVTATGSDVGGFFGAGGATVSSSYYSTSTTGQTRSIGTGAEVAAGKTTAELRQAPTFAGWSLATQGGSGLTWRLYEGQAEPLLLYWLAPLTVTANGGTLSYLYNGSVFNDPVTAVSYNDSARPGRVFGSARYNAGPDVGVYTDLSGLFSNQHGWDIVYLNNGSLSITAPENNTATVSAIVTLPNLPSGAMLSGPLGDRNAAQSWSPMSASVAEGGTATSTTPTEFAADAALESPALDAARSVVSTNTKENLLLRRAFSIGDGGIRLPRDARGSEKDGQ